MADWQCVRCGDIGDFRMHAPCPRCGCWWIKPSRLSSIIVLVGDSLMMDMLGLCLAALGVLLALLGALIVIHAAR
jgi:hypothetical protein